MDRYLVSYTFIIRQCGPPLIQVPILQRIDDGSARSYELSGLEEDTDYTITVTAIVGTRNIDSNSRIVTTKHGRYNYL